MATPLTADRLLSALRAEGVRVVEHRSWRTHNRNHKGPWGPVNGVMIHHTVTSGDTPAQTAASVELCYNGHSSLPGPLCHGVIAKDGTVYLVGNGRANHAGSGDPDVLAAVIAETALPPDDEANTDGNRHFYGFEAINRGDGKDPWPTAQLEAIERVSAALCRAHGWSYRSVIRHLDWQPGKVDPRGVDWPAMQSRIAARLRGAPTTSTPSEEDDTMPLSDADVQRIVRATVAAVVPAVAHAVASFQNEALEPRRDLYQIMRDGAADAKRAADQTRGLSSTGFTEPQLATVADRLADELAARLAN